MTEQTTEAVEYTARENRKYAQSKLRVAQFALVGQSGLSKKERLEHLQDAAVAVSRAKEALDRAFSQVASEPESKYKQESVEPDVENYDADEMEAYAASV